jgi:hypothetical protein
VTTTSLLCAAPPASAQTSVELRVTSVDEGEAKLLEQLLMRQLGDRLLEDGYRVVPVGEAAGVRVWIHLGADEAIVETRGVGRQVERIAGGNLQVMALELQQLTSALIDEVRPADAQPSRAIMIELVGETADLQLRERLQIGLLERGFALTRSPAGDDLRLCVIAGGEGVMVHAVAAEVGCEDDPSAVRVGLGASVEIGRELLVDQAAASLEQLIAGPSPAVTETSIEQTDLPPPDEAGPSFEPTITIEPQPVSMSLAASGGVLGRSEADPLIGLELRGGRRRGVGGALALTLVPSRVESLRVLEMLPTAGLDWRLGFSTRGLAILSAFAGAHVHRYSYAQSATESGTRVGASVGTSVRLAFLAHRGALLFGGLRAGWSGGRWVHLHEGQPIWRRSAVMVGLELGAGWDFVIGRNKRGAT